MAKQRHNQPPPESASKAPLAMMAIGALLVTGLIVWALTRTVETDAPVPSVSSTITPSTDTTASVVPPIDTTTSSVAPPLADTAATSSSPFTMTPPQPTPAAAPQGDKSEVARIAAEDLNIKTRNNSVVVIDVRDATSYASGHIPGALHIPMASVESNLDRIPKDREIVTYCTWPAEETSAGAALILRNHGYTKVSALYGGLGAWRNLNYPVENGPAK